ncbi:MAG: LuxR C-terminal-related transcriptional regulator [Alphaproteobacteria bacterium]|nr:LuxR C-terminal-related transcriptional regulator [Alphaproteobacteria bacterium]MBU2379030.1 LuxR C-terminal-related transcriptional regulator [Alphaproteobacteria bacterium]
MQTDFIDRIYECSVVPELWPGVLDDLAAMTESHGGLLFSARKVLHWTASDTVREVFSDYVNDGWFTRCSRRVCIMSADEPAFFTEQDFWSEDQMGTDPIYRDFFRPRGLGWSAGTGLRIPSGDNIVFSVERSFERGPMEPEHVERLNALRPHLARSALLSARLGLQRAEGAAEALTALRLPALVLDDAGCVVQANEMIQAHADRILIGAGNRIALSDKAANVRLAESLAGMGAPDGAASFSLPLRDGVGQAVGVLHVLPVARSAHDIFGRGYALLVLTPIGADRSPSVDLLRSLFDLTRSEARIAGGLAAGRSVEDIASEGQVAVTTVRSQVRRVLEKTGCGRQAEVTALLAGLTLSSH